MIDSISTNMLKKSFNKITYKFMEIPKPKFENNFGIYIHVPFCFTKCSFCPFYKEIYNKELKNQYVAAIKKEIEITEIKGNADWIYFGGGTPNTLNANDLDGIISVLKSKTKIRSMGIELLPSLVDINYLKDLRQLGFTKISLGVESLSEEVINLTGRKHSNYGHLKTLIDYAVSIGLWVNVDLMIGLSNQTPELFKVGVEKIAHLLPSQITIYPTMEIRDIKIDSNISSKEQFELIEWANDFLGTKDYGRRNIWTFTKGNDLYDTSGDELTMDFAGFGPAAFSTYDNWKIVNPELDVYLHCINNRIKLGLVTPKTNISDQWRKYAKKIYELEVEDISNLPRFIRFLNRILEITGYLKNNKLTKNKGIFFAHNLTKTVVESLPYPLQNPSKIENFNEYVLLKNKITSLSSINNKNIESFEKQIPAEIIMDS
jgi:coproporphyrinogen III oxidase-like Fe-S oxidoreductase